MIVQLLAGIVIAAAVFAALLWSIYRAATTRGRTRLIAVLLGLSTILGMASISLNQPGIAVMAGGACLIFGLYGVWAEDRWSKLLPFAQAVFGLALIAGLPWGGL
ncbi:hypothetical protein C8N43_0257 [Litoreibacter ponti]|uniref:Uncharacterized protein n=1 Tax=Litoreibacter ponti TaxID=1510457 RepID=A0A2T6BHS7_9RHOB|nr:hypothetical protein [Litoreibacter ponti]PTX55618.1 hypothetical protein C8N43_0257 [Litoreibacter ponti]